MNDKWGLLILLVVALFLHACGNDEESSSKLVAKQRTHAYSTTPMIESDTQPIESDTPQDKTENSSSEAMSNKVQMTGEASTISIDSQTLKLEKPTITPEQMEPIQSWMYEYFASDRGIVIPFVNDRVIFASTYYEISGFEDVYEQYKYRGIESNCVKFIDQLIASVSTSYVRNAFDEFKGRKDQSRIDGESSSIAKMVNRTSSYCKEASVDNPTLAYHSELSKQYFDNIKAIVVTAQAAASVKNPGLEMMQNFVCDETEKHSIDDAPKIDDSAPSIKNEKTASTGFKVQLDASSDSSVFATSENFARALNKYVYCPLINNKSVYDIDINSFEFWDENSVSPVAIKGGSSSDVRLPVLLTFDIGFNAEFITAIRQLMETSSINKKQQTTISRATGYIDTFTVQIVEIGPTKGEVHLDYENSRIKNDVYSFNESLTEILTSKHEKFLQNYQTILTVSFFDTQGTELGLSSFEGAWNRRGASTNNRIDQSAFGEMPASGLMYQNPKKGWINGGSQMAELVGGIISDTDANSVFISHQITLGVVFSLTKEEASRINSVNIEMSWQVSSP